MLVQWPFVCKITSERKHVFASNSKFQIESVTKQVTAYTWQLSPGISFVREVLVVNSKSVAHFLLVGDYLWVGGQPSMTVIP